MVPVFGQRRFLSLPRSMLAELVPCNAWLSASESNVYIPFAQWISRSESSFAAGGSFA
jgi:hypothetical protein